jgi:hypothetical protein
MNLHGYFGLNEGEQDTRYRQLADDIYEITYEFLSDTTNLRSYTSKGLDAPQGEPDEGTRAITVSLHEAVRDDEEGMISAFFDTVSFSFIARERKGPPTGDPETVFDFSDTGPFKQGNLGWITVETVLDLDPLEPFPTEWEWYSIAVHNGYAASLWKAHRNHIIHEITHALDWMRWKGTEGPKQRYDSEKLLYGKPDEREAEKRKYLSDPMEMNAVMQQKFYEVVRSLNLTTRDTAIRSMGGSPTGLYNLVLKRFKDEDYSKYATPDFDRRMKKRVAQLWNDILSRYNKPKIPK